MYTEKILPAVCPSGDDGHYGSSANADIIALQAISKRVHYGKQVQAPTLQAVGCVLTPAYRWRRSSSGSSGKLTPG